MPRIPINSIVWTVVGILLIVFLIFLLAPHFGH